tara:strand:- start:284 stop:490 length:207 start_codon:yes stop_codon:yes gene_type:complete
MEKEILLRKVEVMIAGKIAFQYGRGGTPMEKRGYKRLVKDMKMIDAPFFSKLQVRAGYALGSFMRRKK